MKHRPRQPLDGHEPYDAVWIFAIKSAGAAAPARNEEIDSDTMVIAAQLRPDRAGRLRAGTGVNSVTQKTIRYVTENAAELIEPLGPVDNRKRQSNIPRSKMSLTRWIVQENSMMCRWDSAGLRYF